MALFTLNAATAGAKPLQYEQLSSDETFTANQALPTDAASQSAATETRRTLEGTATQIASISPLKPTLGTGSADASQGSGSSQPNLPGSFGLQAAAQNIAATSGALGASSTTAQATEAAPSNNHEGATANASGLGNSFSNSTQTDIFINNNPGTPTNPGGNGDPTSPPPPPPGGPTDPGHNPDPTPKTEGIPLIQVDGLLPLSNLETSVVTPVTSLVTDTLTSVLTQGPAALPGVVEHTVSTVSNVVSDVLHDTGLSVTLNNLGLDPAVAPLIDLDLGNTASNATASLVDGSLLQNAPSLTSILANPLSLLTGSNPLAEITLGQDTSTGEGTLADLNVLNNVNTLADSLNTVANNLPVPVVADIVAGVADALPMVTDTLSNTLGDTLANITIGGTNAQEAGVADLNLLSGLTNAASLPEALGNLLNPANGPLLEISLGTDATPNSEGTLADLNLAETLPNIVSTVTDITTNVPVVNEVLANIPVGNETLGTALKTALSAIGSSELLNLTAGDSTTPTASVADLNLLNNLQTALQGLANPSSADPLLNLSLGNTSTPTNDASLLNLNLLNNTPLVGDILGSTPLAELTLGTNPATNGLNLADTSLTELLNPAPTTGETSLINAGLSSITGGLLPDVNLIPSEAPLVNVLGSTQSDAGLVNLGLSNLTGGTLADVSILPTENPLITLGTGTSGSGTEGSLLNLNLLNPTAPAEATSVAGITLGTTDATTNLTNVGILNHTDLPTDNLVQLAVTLPTAADVSSVATQLANNTQAVASTVTDTTNTVTHAVQEAANTTVNHVADTASTVAGSVTSSVAAVLSQPAAAPQTVVSSVNDIVGSVTSTANHATSTVSSVADTTSHAVASTVAATTTAATSAVSSVLNSVTTTITTPVVTVPPVASVLHNVFHW